MKKLSILFAPVVLVVAIVAVSLFVRQMVIFPAPKPPVSIPAMVRAAIRDIEEASKYYEANLERFVRKLRAEANQLGCRSSLLNYADYSIRHGQYQKAIAELRSGIGQEPGYRRQSVLDVQAKFGCDEAAYQQACEDLFSQFQPLVNLTYDYGRLMNESAEMRIAARKRIEKFLAD